MKTALAYLLCGLASATAFASLPKQEALHPAISISDARATVATVDVPVSFGFLTIRNLSGQEDRLVRVSTAFAGLSEIHESYVDDGLELMRRLPQGIAVPAGGEITLDESGAHLMFMEIGLCLAEGSETELLLEFEKAGKVRAPIRIEATAYPGEHHH